MKTVLGFLATYKLWLMGAAFLLATHLGAFGYGIHTADVRNLNRQVAVAEAGVVIAKNETVAVIQHGNAQAVERIEVKVRDLKRERELASELSTMRDDRDTLQRLLNAKPDPDPDCRLRLGDVRMLDDAATARGDRPDPGASDPARVAAYQEQAASDISCRAFVAAEIDVRLQYNDLAVRHDALVTYIEEEVISPQLSRDITVDLNTDSQ